MRAYNFNRTREGEGVSVGKRKGGKRSGNTKIKKLVLH
jgi:hypothetical protein